MRLVIIYLLDNVVLINYVLNSLIDVLASTRKRLVYLISSRSHRKTCKTQIDKKNRFIQFTLMTGYILLADILY